MTCHTRQDRSTIPPRAVDQFHGVKEDHHNVITDDDHEIQRPIPPEMWMIAWVLVTILATLSAFAVFLLVLAFLDL